MSYIHWNPSPIVFDLGFYSLRWYALFFALAFISSYVVFYFEFKKDNIKSNILDKLTVYIAIGTVLGARLAHCIFYEWHYYSENILQIFLPFQFSPEFKITGFHGLASHGAGIGMLIASILFARKQKWAAWPLLDKIALVIPLGGGFVRLGNLMNSEIIGKQTNVSWAFIFEKIDQVPRHPSQIYEAIFYFIIFGILYQLYKTWRKQPGKLPGVMALLMFTFRFFVEFLKEHQNPNMQNSLINTGQYLSIPLIIAGFGILYYFSKVKYRKNKLKE